jgi:acetoin utilization protein AcuB
MPGTTVADHMSHSLHSLEPGHSMVAARRLMRRHNIRHLPILEDGTLKGIVSQRDLYFVESLDDANPEEITVAEAMTEDVLAVAPETPVAEVARRMAELRVGSVIVIDGGRVAGIFTTMDALQVLAKEA